MITTQDKLAAVERLIQDLRWARPDPSVPEHATYQAMKAIASDLRARLPPSPEQTRRVLGRRIADAVRSKTAMGYDRGHLAGLGEELIGRWHVVEAALERFEKEAARKETA